MTASCVSTTTAQPPERAPPAVAEELAVGDVRIDLAEHEFDCSAPIAKETQEERLDAQEYLQEESFGQRVAEIARGVAEHQPRGQDQEGLDEQRRPTFLGINPSYNIVYLLNIEINTQYIILQMEHRLENHYEETDDDQHFDRRERHLAMAADVVAHQIARTSQQLDESIGERAGVEPPQDGYVLPDRVPPHTSHFGTLTTARTEIITKLRAAVMAMLDGVLMAIDIMRFGLLPASEAVVIRYYLTLISFDRSQFFWLRCP